MGLKKLLRQYLSGTFVLVILDLLKTPNGTLWCHSNPLEEGRVVPEALKKHAPDFEVVGSG